MDFPQDISECAFGSNLAICSPNSIINEFKSVLRSMNIKVSNVDTDASIINKIKSATHCDTESCVLNNDMVQAKIGADNAKVALDTNFKPFGPADNFNLLSNINIDNVLKQLELAHKDEHFLHIPFQMRDFDAFKTGIFKTKDKTDNLADIDLIQHYKDGMRCFGVVFNTDVSSGGGLHWFSIFGDLRKKPFSIEYFNSSGNLPLVEINKWMIDVRHRFIDELSLDEKDIEVVIVSRIIHQSDDHSCGIYALYYILSRILGVPYSHFSTHRIPDELMHKFRKYFFRKY